MIQGKWRNKGRKRCLLGPYLLAILSYIWWGIKGVQKQTNHNATDIEAITHKNTWDLRGSAVCLRPRRDGSDSTIFENRVTMLSSSPLSWYKWIPVILKILQRYNVETTLGIKLQKYTNAIKAPIGALCLVWPESPQNTKINRTKGKFEPV